MNSLVSIIIDSYPQAIKAEVLILRQLILDVAKDLKKDIEETLKWNEPSYLTKGGSTIRIAWKKSSTHQYAMYFNCKTTLVETFREIYPDNFAFEDNRAIVFQSGEKIPINELKHCIQLSLQYHSIKHMPLLGL